MPSTNPKDCPKECHGSCHPCCDCSWLYECAHFGYEVMMGGGGERVK